MQPPSPLPLHLASGPFTVHEARAASLTSGRLRSSDLASAGRLPPVRREGVVGHTVLAFDNELMQWEGIRISTPARTWLDLAHIISLEDLVAVGDQLIR